MDVLDKTRFTTIDTRDGTTIIITTDRPRKIKIHITDLDAPVDIEALDIGETEDEVRAQAKAERQIMKNQYEQDKKTLIVFKRDLENAEITGVLSAINKARKNVETTESNIASYKTWLRKMQKRRETAKKRKAISGFGFSEQTRAEFIKRSSQLKARRSDLEDSIREMVKSGNDRANPIAYKRIYDESSELSTIIQNRNVYFKNKLWPKKDSETEKAVSKRQARKNVESLKVIIPRTETQLADAKKRKSPLDIKKFRDLVESSMSELAGYEAIIMSGRRSGKKHKRQAVKKTK